MKASKLVLISSLLLAFPAAGDDAAALSAFRYLCIGGGYAPGIGPDLGAYPESRPIPVETLLSELPKEAGAEVVDGWEITPETGPGGRLALAIMLFQHPTMGQMASCIILAEGVTTAGLEAGLVGAGAERDGEYMFMEGINRLWFVSGSGPENGIGDGLLMGMTPNGPLPD